MSSSHLSFFLWWSKLWQQTCYKAIRYAIKMYVSWSSTTDSYQETYLYSISVCACHTLHNFSHYQTTKLVTHAISKSISQYTDSALLNTFWMFISIINGILVLYLTLALHDFQSILIYLKLISSLKFLCRNQITE